MLEVEASGSLLLDLDKYFEVATYNLQLTTSYNYNAATVVDCISIRIRRYVEVEVCTSVTRYCYHFKPQTSQTIN